MSDSTETLLKPLAIKQANGTNVISLKDIPDGATAVIPKPPFEKDDDSIEIEIGTERTEHFLGPIADRTFEFTIPKNMFLDFAGTNKEVPFRYIYWFGGVNAGASEPINYRIDH
ncbi:hypothetical protein [Pseudomonas sp. B33.4]|uniref:hypothetical protein n=1 Tax=Pseudomonas sp. B33.4 TaxID=3104265 RepID=UPI002ADEDEA7|nr:hypothetical protein [Pseudomonas sp. B33.4]